MGQTALQANTYEFTHYLKIHDMIQSMTGYGKAQARIKSGTITIELRSLNSKSADISIKSSILPKDKDLIVRKTLASRLVRGTIDMFINYEAAEEAVARPLNASAISSYYNQLVQIRSQLSGFDYYDNNKKELLNNELLASILRLPEVTDSHKAEIMDEQDWPAVEAALDQAIASLTEYRILEGKALYADVCSRVDNILALYDQVESLESERMALVKEKLLKSLEELSLKPDPSRFEQELVYYLEKYDINEEKVRLRQHCNYFKETIDTEECPGKKLGFIIQEMGREINTTGSKANHAGIQKLVVKMKDELEKIREQSMNIL